MNDTTLLRGVLSLALGLAAGFALFTFGVAVTRVAGSSMEPALHDGAIIVVLRPGLDALLTGSRAPHTGDVVVLRIPGTRDHVIKRVVATGGQSVAMDDGVVLVDGAASAAAAVPDAVAGHYSFAVQAVPRKHVFVLGDNRLPLSSHDSRDFGPVAVESVRGRVVLPPTGY